MIEAGFLATAIGVDSAIVEYLVAHHPSADWPAGELYTVPRAPTAFSDLLFIADFLCAIEVDKHQVSIIANRNPSFTDDIPNAGRGVAHPMDNLFQRTAALVDLVEHQRERVLNGRQARR